jgi:hypothetical protein
MQLGDQFAPTPEQIRDCVKALVSSLSQMVYYFNFPLSLIAYPEGHGQR